MRGSKWAMLKTPDPDAKILAVSRECEGQDDQSWFTKSQFIDHVSKLDKKKSGHVAKG